MTVVMLHAHIGSGPQFQELHDNLTRLAPISSRCSRNFRSSTAVSLGGGIPHNYRDHGAQVPIEPLRELFATCQRTRLRRGPARAAAGDRAGPLLRGAGLHARHARRRREADAHQREGQRRDVRDGRCRLRRSRAARDVRQLSRDRRGRARTTTIRTCRASRSSSPARFAKAATSSPATTPNCSRRACCPRPEPGDLLTLRDAGAYGYAMSSNYNSIGRAPQLWLEEDGRVEMISRRETIDDLLKAETSERVL